jgi:hypothetical protein
MKLKLVVASMSVLGLVSAPTFAADQVTTTHKHHKKIHHVVHHRPHHVMTHYVADMNTVAIQPAPVSVETEPKVDTFQAIMDAMNHNTGRSKAMPDWFNRINVSGGANVDAKWGNRRPIYTTENVQRIAINDMYLNLSSTVNDWAKAFASLSYNTASSNYSYVYPSNTFTVEQAYVTLGNLDAYPIFLQVGKQYQDFGRYNIHPINRTLTQSLSETLRTSVNLGFITRMGLHGSVYAFDNVVRLASQGHNKTAYGVSLGYDHPNDQLGYDLGIGYLSNMASVNDVTNFLASGTSVHTVGAVALYADMNSGPFNFGARYTTALQRFSPVDINNNGTVAQPAGRGAEPWAADFTAGYGFNYMAKNQNIYLGYQATGDSVRLALPKSRILAGYGIDMYKNTNLGLEFTHDNAYRVSQGGLANNSNTIGVRAGVKFG